MKKIILCFALSFVLFACADSGDNKEEANKVDTSIIGSDNPNPTPPDSTADDSSKTDSLKIKYEGPEASPYLFTEKSFA